MEKPNTSFHQTADSIIESCRYQTRDPHQLDKVKLRAKIAKQLAISTMNGSIDTLLVKEAVALLTTEEPI